jgi:hypothetical protein
MVRRVPIGPVMGAGIMIVIVLAAVGVGGLAVLVWLWLSASWEVLDDDQLHELSHGTGWLRGWLRPRQRQLSYRRDKRGRFRRIHRW